MPLLFEILMQKSLDIIFEQLFKFENHCLYSGSSLNFS